jgi:osmotically-inducible protein OsmY/nitroimidazol reductase NimA-like FMN-containing flavoprotein (pyridoxamine 5'-phosphate oxidase superfamily)
VNETSNVVDLVRRALEESPNIDSKNIVCSIEDGDLVLEGWVTSYAERLAVLDVASSIEGVAVVHSYLVVKLDLAGRHRTDHELLKDVAEALGALGVLADEVQFTIHQHVVTLKGHAPDILARSTVRHAVQQVPGVDFIENEIAAGTENLPRRARGGVASPIEILQSQTAHLSVDESWDVFGESGIAHLALRDEPTGVDIMPINYLINNRMLYFRSAPGTKLVELTHNPSVAVQAEVNRDGRWYSVVIKGEAERLAFDDEIHASGVLGMRTEQPGEKLNYVRITPHSLTGISFAVLPA